MILNDWFERLWLVCRLVSWCVFTLLTFFACTGWPDWQRCECVPLECRWWKWLCPCQCNYLCFPVHGFSVQPQALSCLWVMSKGIQLQEIYLGNTTFCSRTQVTFREGEKPNRCPSNSLMLGVTRVIFKYLKYVIYFNYLYSNSIPVVVLNEIYCCIFVFILPPYSCYTQHSNLSFKYLSTKYD